MKAQGVATDTLELGSFLTRLGSLWRKHCENKASQRHQVSHPKRADAPTAPGAVIRDAAAAMNGQPSQPAMVNLGPVLALLTMLRNRRPHRCRPRWQDLRLPRGCVLAARYASR